MGQFVQSSDDLNRQRNCQRNNTVNRECIPGLLLNYYVITLDDYFSTISLNKLLSTYGYKAHVMQLHCYTVLLYLSLQLSIQKRGGQDFFNIYLQRTDLYRATLSAYIKPFAFGFPIHLLINRQVTQFIRRVEVLSVLLITAHYPVYCYTSVFLLFPSTLILPTIWYFPCFHCLFAFTNLSIESITIHLFLIMFPNKCFLILNTFTLYLSTPALLNSPSFYTLFTYFIISILLYFHI